MFQLSCALASTGKARMSASGEPRRMVRDMAIPPKVARVGCARGAGAQQSLIVLWVQYGVSLGEDQTVRADLGQLGVVEMRTPAAAYPPGFNSLAVRASSSSTASSS